MKTTTLRDHLGDIFKIGANARTDSTIAVNAENASRRAACLSAVEREFFTHTVEDEDGGEVEKCPLNWGAEPAEYVEQMRGALAALMGDRGLTAAAPDLLAACVEFVRKCDSGHARSEKSYAQMVAAIAKAGAAS